MIWRKKVRNASVAIDQPAIGVERGSEIDAIAAGEALILALGEARRSSDASSVADAIASRLVIALSRAVFGGDHLALFGEALHRAVYRPGRLRLDRGEGGSAAAPDRTAAPVEKLHRDARFAEYRLERVGSPGSDQIEVR